MSDATASNVVRRVLLLSLACCGVAVIPGHSGVAARQVLLTAAGLSAAAVACAPGLARGWWKSGWPLLGLVLPAIVSTIFAAEPERALLGSPYLGGGLAATIGFCCLAFAVSIAADGATAAARVVGAGVISAIFGYALIQKFGLDPLAARAGPFAGVVRGPFSAAAACGGVVAVLAPLIHAGAFDGNESPSRRKFYALVPLIAAATMVLCGVRGPIAALTAGLWAVHVSRLFTAGKGALGKILLVAGLFTLVACLAMNRGSPERPGVLLDAATEAGDARDGLQAGATFRLKAADGLRTAFGFGPGHGRYAATTRAPEPSGAVDERDGGAETVRGFMQDTLFELGWFGLIGATLFFTYLVRSAAIFRRPSRFGATGAVAAYVAFRQFESATPAVEFVFAVAAGFLLRPRGDAPTESVAKIGAVSFGVKETSILAFGAILAGVGAATLFSTTTCLVLYGVAFACAVAGRPAPLRVAAAAIVVVACVAWRPLVVRVAERDDARPAWVQDRVARGEATPNAAMEYATRVAADETARSWELTAAAAVMRGAGDDAGASRLAALAARKAPRDGFAAALAARYATADDDGSARVATALRLWPWDSGLHEARLRDAEKTKNAAALAAARKDAESAAAAAAAAGDRDHAERLKALLAPAPK